MKNVCSYDGDAGVNLPILRWQPDGFNATIFFSSHAGKMMKKVAIVAAMLTLAGCVQVENYQDVV
ncbi:hypothetical protein ACS0TU_09065, partial [Enterobacter hormaechei]